MKSKIEFRVFPEGDAIALFPDEPVTPCGEYINSYQVVGEHSPASKTLLRELRKARPSELRSLYYALRMRGYKFDRL